MSTEYHKKEAKTLWVVLLSAVAMVVEIIFGIITNSMALFADGIHMGAHVLAIGLSWLAYVVVRRVSNSDKFNGNSNKILSLSGYSSGLFLLLFSIGIIFEATVRLFNPVEIVYKVAMIVACIGLVINIVSAFFLHHHHEDSDHNIRAAYIHVIADALTSLSAILGLLAAMIWDLPFIDAIIAILSAMVVIKWSIGILKDSGSILLDLETVQKVNNSGVEHINHHHIT